MVSLGTMGRSEEAIATELGLADEHCCDHVNASSQSHCARNRNNRLSSGTRRQAGTEQPARGE